MGELIMEVRNSKGELKSGYRQTRGVLQKGGSEIKRFVKTPEKKFWEEKSLAEIKALESKKINTSEDSI